jgi:Xaa-Pro dipeptidase
MTSRREFLGASAAAATGLALGTSDDAVASSLPSDPDALQDPLPPSIARLTSQKHRARPITKEERAGRIEHAKSLMRANRIDAIMLSGGTTMRYFTNISWGLSERMMTVIIPVKGEAFVVTPAFEEARTREQLALGPLEHAEVLTWNEDESPYKRVQQGLAKRGIAAGRIGVEETVPFVYSNGVANAAPALHVTSGTPITYGCRGIKDDHEIELMRLANELTLTAYKAAYLAMREGMTQHQFAALVSTAHDRLGYAGGGDVQVGEWSALPHGSITPQVIRQGTILLIDGGCNVEGYQSDISRTFVLGRPTDKMLKVFDIEKRAQTAAWKAAKPGVEAQSVDRAARSVIEEAGFGPGYKYFGHRVGHGIGMDWHEWPYLVKGNTTLLKKGMTFSDEPGVYIPGEFGVRLEDDMLITSDGSELFTPQSPSLEDPFGNWPH